MKKIYARNGNVTLKRRPANVRASGLVIAGESDDRMMYTVDTVGEGYLHENGSRVPISLTPGDVVFLAPGTNVAVLEDVDGSELLIVSEANILARETDDGAPTLVKANLN